MLADQIKADMTAAMKGKQPLQLSVLRMLQSALGYKQIETQRALTDAEVLTVVANEAKKRREAIESYKQANRLEQMEKERQELDILAAYLPKQLSEDEVRAEIGAMAEIKGITDFGQVMRVVSPKFKGRADGQMVANSVKEMLANG